MSAMQTILLVVTLAVVAGNVGNRVGNGGNGVGNTVVADAKLEQVVMHGDDAARLVAGV